MSNSNSGWDTTGSGSSGGSTTGGSGTATGTSGSGSLSGAAGSGMGGSGMGTSGSMGSGSGMGSMGSSGGLGSGGGIGTTSATDGGVCPTCGHSSGNGLEQFLGRLGITDDMVSNLKGQFANVDIDEYLNTAREYLKGGSTKATAYAKDNPGKVAAGVAALALGAGLIYAAVNRDKA
ncbi:MAG TPA: hypothetical protein VF824_16740 [Thermoanaerobaculia bacterium]|jgi:hypothetical protein